MEMAKGLSSSWKVMMKELIQGRELAKQLHNHLDPSTPHETREYLIEKILCTYNKALDMANLGGHFSPTYDPHPHTQINFLQGGNKFESAGSSPGLEDHLRPSKKRKKLPSWVKTVKVSTETAAGLEGPLNDGYNWRKYGQKDIHGAAFPRSYYRCTHHFTQGCPAKKQIQKSNGDPTVFQVIYRGHHTCFQVGRSASRNPPPVRCEPVYPVEHEPEPGPKPAQHNPRQQEQNHMQQIASEPQLKEETEDLDISDPENLFFRSYSFSSALLGAGGRELVNDRFILSSPATSDSNQGQYSSAHIAGGVAGVWTPESDFNEQGAADPNTLMVDLEFTLDELGIDPNFPFNVEHFY